MAVLNKVIQHLPVNRCLSGKDFQQFGIELFFVCCVFFIRYRDFLLGNFASR